jgi:hypothetical protein
LLSKKEKQDVSVPKLQKKLMEDPQLTYFFKKRKKVDGKDMYNVLLHYRLIKEEDSENLTSTSEGEEEQEQEDDGETNEVVVEEREEEVEVNVEITSTSVEDDEKWNRFIHTKEYESHAYLNYTKQSWKETPLYQDFE